MNKKSKKRYLLDHLPVKYQTIPCYISKKSMGNCENHLNVCPPASINMKSKVTLKYQNYLFPSNNEAGQFMSIACLRGGWEKLLRIKSNSSYDTWHTTSYFLLIKPHGETRVWLQVLLVRRDQQLLESQNNWDHSLRA